MAPKQIYDLNLSDLREYPIWAYLSEDEPNAADECTIVPRRLETFDFETMYVALATFKLACGRQYSGYVHPEAALANAQPCMFVAETVIAFWSGIVQPTSEWIAETYGLLDLSAADVFPIRWYTDYSPDPELRSGTIDGFGYISGDGDRFVS